MKVIRLSALRTGRLYPPTKIPGTHFCSRLSRPQSHSAAGNIMSMKNSNDTTHNHIRTWNAVIPGKGIHRRWYRYRRYTKAHSFTCVGVVHTEATSSKQLISCDVKPELHENNPFAERHIKGIHACTDFHWTTITKKISLLRSERRPYGNVSYT
jgi:hypothetical protein